MRHLVKSVLMVILTITMMIITIMPAFSEHGYYTAEVLFTIPWGDGVDEISLGWKGELPPDEPEGTFIAELGPSAINSTGGFVILEFDVIKKFNIDGTFAGSYDMDDIWNMSYCGSPCLSIEQNGYVLLGCANYIHLLNPQLELVTSIQIPRENIPHDRLVYVSSISPSNNGFWVDYTNFGHGGYRFRYRIKCHLDGTLSEPILRNKGYLGQDPFYRPMDTYISPTGETFPWFTDEHGYVYKRGFLGASGYPMTKKDAQGVVIYEHHLDWVDDWGNLAYHFSWSGDFFTEQGTPDGLSITKHSLQLE